MLKDLIQTVGLLYLFYCLFWRFKKKSSEKDQLTGRFQSFPPPPPNPKSEKKNPINQLIKKFWPKAANKI